MANINITTRAQEVVTKAKEAASGSFVEKAKSLVPGTGDPRLDAAIADLGSGSQAFDAALSGTPISNSKAPITKEAKINANKFPNPLRQFATVNYLWTLSCLTTTEVNYPDATYRVKPATVQVLRDGGGATGKALTAFETNDAQLEYFIDNVEIQSIISPGQGTRTSNATSLTFTVHEPYSMGLFLQSLMVAAKKAQGPGADYLRTPYMLSLEFIGYDDKGNIQNPSIAKRRIPIKFIQIEFEVNAGGCAYTVQAIPWNEQAQSTVSQSVQQDVKLVGNNVLEILQKGPNSLTGIINKAIQERAAKNETPTKDEYIIVFPQDLISGIGNFNAAATGNADRAAMTPEQFFRQVTGIDPENADPAAVQQALAEYEKYIELSAADNNISASIRSLVDNTANVNDIGKGEMAKSMAEGGAVPFGRERFTVREINGKQYYANDQVQISLDFREFTFPQGTTIEKIIEEIIVLSTYAQNAATVIQEDAEGNIPWFRIQTQTFLIPDADWQRRTGENPKLYVYMVVPYKVSSSVFQSPTQAPPGATEKKISALKSYNYIYSGLNEDIVDFEIRFNNAFFSSLNADGGNANAGVTSQVSEGTNSSNQPGFRVAPGAAGSAGSLSGNRPLRSQHNATRPLEGGADYSNTAIQIARQFNEAIVNSNVDLISMELTVLGDPYYLSDSGMGNFNSPPLITGANQDGTMDHQRGEIDVLVNFRTPVDYNATTGGMIFPEDTVPVKAFSGLYKVNTVTNRFEGGKYTQILELIRRPNQDTDIGAEGTPGSNRPVESAAAGDTSLTEAAARRLAAGGTADSSGAGDEAEAQRIAGIQAARAQGANTGF